MVMVVAVLAFATFTVAAAGLLHSALGADFREVAAAHIHMQGFAEVEAVVDILLEQQLQAVAGEAHQVAFDLHPDKFTGRRDAAFQYVEAEGVLAEAHQVAAGLGVEADEALQVIGGGTDAGGCSVHARPHG